MTTILKQISKNLHHRRLRQAPAVELAFFGGTFTAMPEAGQAACLNFAREEFRAGNVCALRCSTRPDCLNPAALARLAEAGCTTVELGIQSFSTPALTQAHRGYTGTTAREACARIREAGFRLGVQLMPGMPGVTPDVFLSDARTALDCGADFLRYYPCLVLAGTALAESYLQKLYTPWELPVTISTLAKAWLSAREAGIPVIRMGLAPETGLDEAVLAGPVHPALGAEVQATALLELVRGILAQSGVATLAGITLPRHCQGFFWGGKRRLAPDWASLGITGGNLSSHDAAEIHLILS